MVNGNKTNLFRAELQRLLTATGSENYTQLASALGITSASVSRAIKREMIPGGWVKEVAQKYRVSADWLLFGDEKYPEKVSENPSEKTQPAPPPTERVEVKKTLDYNNIAKESALDLEPADFKELWDEYWNEKKVRRGWLQVEVIKRFPEFLEWLEQRPAPLKPAQIAAAWPSSWTTTKFLPNLTDKKARKPPIFSKVKIRPLSGSTFS